LYIGYPDCQLKSRVSNFQNAARWETGQGGSSVARQPVQLTLHLHAGTEADREEQAHLTQRLRENLLELNVDRVEPVRSGTTPAGAKGDPATLAALVVTMAPMALTEVMKALQTWLSRHDRASVSVESGGGKIVVTGSPSKEQQQLIEAFVSRHKL
jgi:hypothetical protein